MTYPWLGPLLLVVGLVSCLRGQAIFRGIMSFWGGLIGFGIGAALEASLSGRQLLTGPLGWTAAVIGALILSAAAYGFYRVGVILAVGGLGYGLGTAIVTSITGGDRTASVIGGLAVAVLVAVVAALVDLPTIALVVATALVGATATVNGLRLMSESLPIPTMVDQVLPFVGASWWWTVTWVALAVTGVAVQWRASRR